MNKKTTFGIGEYCCLALAEYDFATAVKKAYSQGYSYVVRYENVENNGIHIWHRTIIGWGIEQVSFDEVSVRYKEYENISKFIWDAFRKGMKFFVVAPYTEGCEVFPAAYFDAVDTMSLEQLNELLKS